MQPIFSVRSCDRIVALDDTELHDVDHLHRLMAGDRIGRLKLSKDGLARRDHLVLATCRDAGLPVACGGITVGGRFEVERADRTLLCDWLLVQGSGSVFEVGTATNRFLQKFTLTLKGLPEETAMSMGAKVLGAQQGGTIRIHAKDRTEWTFLGANAAAGATSLTLSENIDWQVGDTILVTSSRLAWSEAETRTITAVSGRTVSFTPGLGFMHNGSTTTRTRSSDGKSWTANLRAEVGLLSRNIKIQGDAASESVGFGGHIMVMPTSGVSGYAYIQGVELYRMGQKSALGRYPMHWHMCAQDGAGRCALHQEQRQQHRARLQRLRALPEAKWCSSQSP